MISKFFKQIFSISINIPSPKIGTHPTLLNMPQELYEDAVYFLNQEIMATDPRIKLRYKRVALICFCSSTEAWISSQLRSCISHKASRTRYDQSILDFIEQSTNRITPDDCRTIKKRLYRCVAKVFTGAVIDPSAQRISAFEDYINLSEARNAIVHYATKNQEVVYDIYFNVQPSGITKSLQDAPQIILSLYNEIHSLNNTFQIPSWAL